MRWILVCMLAMATRLGAQIPNKFTNLQVLPKSIPRDSLVNIMRRFSLSLEVRCQYCHKSADNVSFKDVDFASDDKLPKRRARFMLRMVDSLNRVVLPQLPGLEGNAIRIECKTCHRGRAHPALLTQELERVRDTAGIDAAVARYRQLREKEAMFGRWDFDEWEMNLWSEQLARSHPDDAIKAYELNLEFNPQSTSILTALGRLLENSDRAKAIEYFEKALAIAPNSPQIRKRVDSLKAIPR